MAKKTFTVLNAVLHGSGRTHRLLKAGDTVEFDPEDEADRETVAELVAKDYIEDPDNPRKRTPEEKMKLETRQLEAARLAAPGSGAVRSEQAVSARMTKIEEGLITPSAADDRSARARVLRSEGS